MHTIRSFVAIPLSPQVGKNARNLIRDLSEERDGVQWVPIDNLHLTLKFLGDVVDREVPQVCLAIRQVCAAMEPFGIELAGTGGFPSIDRPRVLWAGIVDGGEALIDLVSRLEIALADLGFKPEPRDYRPHLTLGRVRGSNRIATTDVITKLTRYTHRRLGAMEVDQVRLYASYLDKAGPTYHVMDTIPLGAAAAGNDIDHDDRIGREEEE